MKRSALKRTASLDRASRPLERRKPLGRGKGLSRSDGELLRGTGGRAAAHVARVKTCERCGDEFYDRQAGRKQRYCSMDCAAEGASEKARRRYPPREEIERLYVEEGFTDRQLAAHYGHSYTWSLNVRKHYGIPAREKGSWRRKPLAQKSDRNRWAISMKREPTCRNCGEVGLLSLHHAVPRSLCRAGKYDLRNGVPLCARCHLGWHNRLVTLYRDIFTAEEWEFISSLRLSGQRIEAWLDDRYPERLA